MSRVIIDGVEMDDGSDDSSYNDPCAGCGAERDEPCECDDGEGEAR